MESEKKGMARTKYLDLIRGNNFQDDLDKR